MTNKEWIVQIFQQATDDDIAKMISKNTGTISTDKNCPCHGCEATCGTAECEDQIKEWLNRPYVPPKKELTQAQLCEAFEVKFGDRRAIGLQEVKQTIEDIFK